MDLVFGIVLGGFGIVILYHALTYGRRGRPWGRL